MGQKINPNGIRIVCESARAYPIGYFTNHWYSDFKYSSLVNQDVWIRKSQIRILLKYYKTKMSAANKGRHRGFKPCLRYSNDSFFLLRLPYKVLLLFSFFRPAVLGLQKKHTVFIYKTRK